MLGSSRQNLRQVRRPALAHPGPAGLQILVRATADPKALPGSGDGPKNHTAQHVPRFGMLVPVLELGLLMPQYSWDQNLTAGKMMKGKGLLAFVAGSVPRTSD